MISMVQGNIFTVNVDEVLRNHFVRWHTCNILVRSIGYRRNSEITTVLVAPLPLIGYRCASLPLSFSASLVLNPKLVPPETVCTGNGCAIDQPFSGSALPLEGANRFMYICKYTYDGNIKCFRFHIMIMTFARYLCGLMASRKRWTS